MRGGRRSNKKKGSRKGEESRGGGELGQISMSWEEEERVGVEGVDGESIGGEEKGADV